MERQKLYELMLKKGPRRYPLDAVKFNDQEGETEMKRYFVTVQAVVRKTIEVEAETRDEAVGLAHEAFTVENDGGPEYYKEETVDVEELQ